MINSQTGLPEWPAFQLEKAQTMVFDAPCKVMSDPDKEARQVVLNDEWGEN